MSENKTKEDWIEKYVTCILKLWQDWQEPLASSAEEYIEHIKEELRYQYDDPLKRSMVELNYPKTYND